MGLFGKSKNKKEEKRTADLIRLQHELHPCPKCGSNKRIEMRPAAPTYGEIDVQCECTKCGHKWSYKTFLTGSPFW